MHSLFWIFVELCTCIFEVFLIFIFLEGFLNYRPNTVKARLVAFLLAFAVQFVVSTFFYNVQYAMLISYTTITIVISILFCSGKIYIRLFSGLFLVVMNTVVEVFSMFLVGSVGNLDINLLNVDPVLKLITIVTKNMLGLIVIKAVVYFRRSAADEFRKGYRLLLLVVPAISLLIAYVILDLAYKAVNYNIELALFGLLGILYVNLIVFSIFEGFLRQVGREYRYKLMEKQYDMQLAHYNQLAESRAHIREIWHDFKNHVSCLQMLYHNKEPEALGRYIDNLTHFGEVEKVIDTGNPVIDALLNNKESIAKQNGIQVNTALNIPFNLAISPADACVILGNSIDNAIEACKRITNESIEKVINLSLTYQNGYLVYVITNSIDQVPRKEGGRYKTWKSSPESHGLGMQSIERAVRQYNGNMVSKDENGTFTLEIILLIETENMQGAV
jgi:two-component system sensor histidine kinase AgrC